MVEAAVRRPDFPKDDRRMLNINLSDSITFVIGGEGGIGSSAEDVTHAKSLFA